MANIPLKILKVDETNNKSITVTIEGDFLGTEDFIVCKMADESQIINVVAVDDSIDPSPNKKVVVTTGDALFEKGTVYILKISRDNEKDTEEFTVGKFLPPNRAFIKTFGDRIVKIEFTTPIKNLDARDRVRAADGVTIPDEKHVELRNFYFLYDSLNISGSDAGADAWLGFIRYYLNEDEETIFDRIKSNHVRVSEDFKSIEIQYNHKGIPSGNNRVIVHYSNNQVKRVRKNKDLSDFYDPPREVPVMTLGFKTTKEDDIAEAISCESINRTEIVVTFNKAVILLQSYRRGCLYINGKPATAKNIKRVGHEFNKLKFYLEVDSALPLKSCNIKVEEIIDANGYKVPSKDFLNVPVISIPPKIKTLTQIDPPNDQTTSMIALWSKDMKYFLGNPNMPGVVNNIANYTLVDGSNKEITVASLIYNEQTRELEIMTPKLDSGLYVLTVKNCEDVVGEKMLLQEISINIEDRTIPKVVDVVYRKDVNTFVVKFDDIMSIIGEHSALESSNYLIEKSDLINNVRNVLPTQTKALAINGNKWMRFMLPEESNLLPPSPITGPYKYALHIGYPLVKKIKYVEDASKNIYPLCNFQSFNEFNMINIENGDKRIISDNKLRFVYTGNNEIYSASVGDFDFSIDGGNFISSVNVEKKDWKTLEFTFPKNTFNGNVNQIIMKIIENPLSLDIFGAPFKGLVTNSNVATNGLSPELKEVSLIKKDEDIVNQKFKVTLRFVFTKALLIFNRGDYKITLNNYPAPLVIKNFIPVNPINNLAYIFDTEIDVPHPISLSDVFIISLVGSNYILSKDSSGNSLAPFEPKLVEKLIATNLNWNYQNGVAGLKGDSLEIVYNKPINPSSVMTGWNGSEYSIPISAISFNKNAKVFEMQIAATNLGVIRFYPQQDPDIVTNNQFIPFAAGSYPIVSNTAPAIITLINQNKLVIKFDIINENADVNASSIAFVEYIASSRISDIESKIYLYEAYSPTDVLN